MLGGKLLVLGIVIGFLTMIHPALGGLAGIISPFIIADFITDTVEDMIDERHGESEYAPADESGNPTDNTPAGTPTD